MSVLGLTSSVVRNIVPACTLLSGVIPAPCSVPLSIGCMHALMMAAIVVLLAATRPTSLGPEMADTTGGHCSEADLAKVSKAGDGTSPSSFPEMCTECGKTSWSLLGFDTKKYSRCFARKSRISLPCAGCYAGSGE